MHSPQAPKKDQWDATSPLGHVQHEIPVIGSSCLLGNRVGKTLRYSPVLPDEGQQVQKMYKWVLHGQLHGNTCIHCLMFQMLSVSEHVVKTFDRLSKQQRLQCIHHKFVLVSLFAMFGCRYLHSGIVLLEVQVNRAPPMHPTHQRFQEDTLRYLWHSTRSLCPKNFAQELEDLQ